MNVAILVEDLYEDLELWVPLFRLREAGLCPREIRVVVQSAHLPTGERRETSTADVSFVAIDTQGRPKPVPPLILESEDERREARAAEARRAARLGDEPATPPKREKAQR